ncbi:MAG: lysylphosphatidylglycerol synthase transmembrane domain-containing protein [Cyclobacteriaceae bacterium]
MNINSKEIFKTLNPNRIWIPVLIGVGIVAYLFISDPDFSVSKLSLVFDAELWPFLLAILVIVLRDTGYVYRIKVLTNHDLDWVSSIYVIILWEFASAVTPSVVGGTTIVVFVLMKEGLRFGRALAYVMLTAILDNLFFLIMSPLALLYSNDELFPNAEDMQVQLGNSLQVLFLVSYGLIAIYTAVMCYALFIRPRGFKWVLLRIGNLPFIRRWKHHLNTHGDEVILASQQLRGKRGRYWTTVLLLTFLIWTARYAVLNCLITAFSEVSWSEHLLIFCRHLMMWIVMLVSPTPGSSGTAEFFFNQFFYEFLGDYTIVTNILWRMLTYYPYLLLGAVFLPRWIRRVFFQKKEDKVPSLEMPK